MFYLWVFDDLVLKLPKNAVLITDNASFYKREDIQKAVTDTWFEFLCLPIYSPDLNPREKTL